MASLIYRSCMNQDFKKEKKEKTGGKLEDDQIFMHAKAMPAGTNGTEVVWCQQ